ncbi:MAG: PA4642 family protein [Cellvibrionaceae bacterium]
MALKKDKQKVLGEVFDDERIKTFLDYEAYGDANPDYHLLEKAYRGMKADNFTTFLDFFIAEGHDINAKNQQGNSFFQTIEKHRPAEDYIEAMKARGGI